MSRASVPVSFVMSVYNNAATLARAIDSVLEQTFRDFEFIIINDGSSDESTSVLHKYAQQDSRIVLMEQRNEGLTRSLIRGIAAASGIYIARQDADDVSEPHRLEKQMAFMPSYDVVAARSRREDGRPRPSCLVASFYRYSMAFKNPFYHGTLLFKKDAYERAGGYDPDFRFAQDYDLMARMITRARARVKYIMEPLYRTFSGEASIGVARRKEQDLFAGKVRQRLVLSYGGILEKTAAH